MRIGFFEVIGGTCHATAAAGGEHIECLAVEVVGLNKCVDDGRSGVPPHGEANPYGVVVGDILATSCYRGTRRLVCLLDSGARGLVAPVEVGGGVRLSDNLITFPSEIWNMAICSFSMPNFSAASSESSEKMRELSK